MELGSPSSQTPSASSESLSIVSLSATSEYFGASDDMTFGYVETRASLRSSHADVSTPLDRRSTIMSHHSLVMIDNQELGINKGDKGTKDKPKINPKKLAMFLTGEAFLWDKTISSAAALLPKPQQTIDSSTLISTTTMAPITQAQVTLSSSTVVETAGTDWLKIAQSLVGLTTNSVTLTGTLATQLPILHSQSSTPPIKRINAAIKVLSQSALWLSPVAALFSAIGIPALGALNLARCASGLGMAARSLNITATLIDIILNKKDLSLLPERLQKLLTNDLSAVEKVQLNDMLRLIFKESLNLGFLTTQITEFCQGASSKVLAKVYLVLIALNHTQLAMKAYSLASTTIHDAVKTIQEPTPEIDIKAQTALNARTSIIIPGSTSRAPRFECL